MGARILPVKVAPVAIVRVKTWHLALFVAAVVIAFLLALRLYPLVAFAMTVAVALGAIGVAYRIQAGLDFWPTPRPPVAHTDAPVTRMPPTVLEMCVACGCLRPRHLISAGGFCKDGCPTPKRAVA